MLRITRNANGEVVFKVSGQLTGEKRGGDGGTHCSRKKRQTNCLGLYRFDSAAPYWEEEGLRPFLGKPLADIISSALPIRNFDIATGM